MSKFPYYKSLDGVRGVAVLMVLLYHTRLLPIGWVGVQIFFVLSGFLITGILLTQTERPFPVFLRQFYWRRGLRIWPLYFLYVAICCLAYSITGIPESWPNSWGPVVTFTYNIVEISKQFQRSDYFGHFWTLCVEEQFYLLWPLLVFVLPLKLFRRFVVFVVLAGPVVRLLTAVFFSHYFAGTVSIDRAVGTLPFSHFDAFAFGALIAALPPELRRRLNPMAVGISLAVLSVTIAAGLVQAWCLQSNGLPPHWHSLGYDNFAHYRQYVWAFTLLNLSSAAFIFCAMENAAIARILSFRPLVFVGMISYGLYVWHLPLMRLFSIFWPPDTHSLGGLVRFAVYLAASIGTAALSYLCYERHFLKIKNRSPASPKRPLLTGEEVSVVLNRDVS